MEGQKELIHEANWDYLVILDACRYDFLKELYADFFRGDLKRVESEGTCTGEWLAKTFDEYYPNITYISGMPHVNSWGLSLNETHGRWGLDWKSTDHFADIVDVWDFGWSEELGFLPPKALSEAAIQASGENRKIIHYAQPHGPYIPLIEGGETKRKNESEERKFWNRYDRFDKLRIFLERNLVEFFIDFTDRVTYWKLKRILNVSVSAGGLEQAWRRGGVERVKSYYKENLRRALEAVLDLVENVKGNVVVTSDHGECLGEEGYWTHGWDGSKKIPRIPVLVGVPWLEVEG